MKTQLFFWKNICDKYVNTNSQKLALINKLSNLLRVSIIPANSP